ncbi:MAG: hypothetical protein NW224_01795 [Leptolyngbyaceae cyanobacterium bins.302]|nr:hypothetical protein [Leptolyngbyaceae cyanobacterium bins.302]
MLNEMCWLSPLGSNNAKILHLRTAPNEPWRPYTAFPQYAAPDYDMPGGSKGWATYQKLMRAGWKLAPSSDINSVISDVKAG